MCNIWNTEKSDDLSLEEMRRIFSDPLFASIEQVAFSGGESTLRDDLPQIVELVLDSLPKLKTVVLLTNGLAPKRTVRIIEQSLNVLNKQGGRIKQFVIQVSLDGIGRTHDNIRGIEGAFEKVVDTVNSLKKLATVQNILHLFFHCVVQPLNVQELELIENFTSNMGTYTFYSLPVISDGYFANSNLETTLRLDKRQKDIVKKFYRRIADRKYPEDWFYYKEMLKMLDGAPKRRRCMMGTFMMHLESDGTVYPCLNSYSLKIGNLKSQSMREIWYGARAKDLRKRVRREQCPSCVSACYSGLVGIKEVACFLKFQTDRLWKTSFFRQRA